MAQIKYSPAAKADLQEIRSYIEQDLCNPIAAKNTVEKIFQSIRTLERFPFSGSPLCAGGLDTDYRNVTSGNYRVFYRCDENTVFVIRVLYGRRDYMRILFGIPSAVPDEEESF